MRNQNKKSCKTWFLIFVFVFRSVFFAAGFLLWNHLWFQGCEHRICVHTWNKIRSFWGNTPKPWFWKIDRRKESLSLSEKSVFAILHSTILKSDFWKFVIFGNQNWTRKNLSFEFFDLIFWNNLLIPLPVYIRKNPRCFRGLRAQILGTILAPKSAGKANRQKLTNWKTIEANTTGKEYENHIFCFVANRSVSCRFAK